MKKFLLFIGFNCLLIACEKGGSGVKTLPPEIEITCSGGKCSGVTGFRDVVVNITKSGCQPDSIDYEHIAAGTGSVFCSGSSCTGSIGSASWSETTIPESSYYVCGWININSSNAKDSQDAFSENYQYVSGSSILMTNWSVTYTFSRKIPQN
ncbi:MAG: hypothetical protein H6623_04235 [Bdellovibrionaceae bacterium]|nr:hypothetical protein [Pseudobdellovibrionaceae bacterium]